MIWKEVDGKLREPTLQEVDSWAFGRYHCRLVSREWLAAAAKLTDEAKGILQSGVAPTNGL